MSGDYALKHENRQLLVPFCPGPSWPRALRDWRVAEVLMRRGSIRALLNALGEFLVALYSDGRDAIVGTLVDRRVGPWMDTLRAFAADGTAELRVLPALAVQGPVSAPFELDGALRVITACAERNVDPSTIVLDAHLAFGSGVHPTTRLCAQLLGEIEGSGAVLDIGCGSGILTLLAARRRAVHAKRGARTPDRFSVVAVDPDPYARAVCRYNLDANGLRAPVIARLPRRRFGLLLANLWPDALMQLADDMKKLLLPGGYLLASGAHEEDMARLIPRLWPLQPTRVVASDGWGALLLQAPQDGAQRP